MTDNKRKHSHFDFKYFASQQIANSAEVKLGMLENSDVTRSFEEMCCTALKTLKQRKKILFAGNGGSYSDAIHLTAELIGRFKLSRQPLPAIALGANGSSLTAIGNDFGYDEVFSRELEAISEEGDLLIVLSTSGNSTNIVKAIQAAHSKDIECFGMTGRHGGLVAEECKCIRIPSGDTARIQECHIMLGHIMCEYLELMLTNSKPEE